MACTWVGGSVLDWIWARKAQGSGPTRKIKSTTYLQALVHAIYKKINVFKQYVSEHAYVQYVMQTTSKNNDTVGATFGSMAPEKK